MLSFGKHSADSSSQRFPWSRPSERKGCSLSPAQLCRDQLSQMQEENKGQALSACTLQAPVLGELHSNAHHMVSAA